MPIALFTQKRLAYLTLIGHLMVIILYNVKNVSLRILYVPKPPDTFLDSQL